MVLPLGSRYTPPLILPRVLKTTIQKKPFKVGVTRQWGALQQIYKLGYLG